MANGLAAESSSGNIRTICLPIGEEEYRRIVDDSTQFRRCVDRCYKETPELFPEGFEKGYELKDRRESRKTGLTIRRIELRDGTSYSVRPSFLMPYLSARTDGVESPLFLRKFGIPYWALARVFGHDGMYWYRLETGLGRNSIVGTTVRRAALPEHVLADEHRQTRNAEKNYIATTAGKGVVFGAAVAETAGTDDLTAAYAVFRDEARNVQPDDNPRLLNTDAWKGAKAAWKCLFPMILIIRCFLHGWLKIRDRAKHLKETFAEISERVWDAYHAPDRRTFSQRIRALKSWALLHNFAPWCPAATRNNAGWRSPAERLNKHRYHDNWLHNLLVSASLAGYRIRGPRKT